MKGKAGMFLYSDVLFLIVGTVIATLGSGAIVSHVFRRTSHQRVLLWFGLFALPYGMVLILRNPAFQLGFGTPTTLGRIAERLVAFWTVVPGLLLFKAFYGEGWRSSVRWLIGSYIAIASIAFTLIVFQDRPDFTPSPATGLILLVPTVLIIGRFAGYQSPRLPHQRVLFAGLLFFFLAFSRDHLVNAHRRFWRPGLEPYGFLILTLCLGYVAAQRVIASERQLISLTDEMRAAVRIQTSILPRTLPATEHLEIAVRYAPMTAIAGDLYDFTAIDAKSVGILVADVTGHGVPAALVASMIKIAVSMQTGRHREPATVITGLNSILCHEAEGQYATGVYVYLDQANCIARYSAAAHPPPLLWRRNTQTLHALNETGLLLGVRPNEEYVDREFAMCGGDRLLLYTDGLLEAENMAGQSFGDVVLADFVRTRQGLGAELFVDQLLTEVLAWSSHGGKRAQADDITIVVIDVKHRDTGRA
jgi:sigma-B regulation protein RsbU (phosphoserine phosphatase)